MTYILFDEIRKRVKQEMDELDELMNYIEENRPYIERLKALLNTLDGKEEVKVEEKKEVITPPPTHSTPPAPVITPPNVKSPYGAAWDSNESPYQKRMEQLQRIRNKKSLT